MRLIPLGQKAMKRSSATAKTTPSSHTPIVPVRSISLASGNFPDSFDHEGKIENGVDIDHHHHSLSKVEHRGWTFFSQPHKSVDDSASLETSVESNDTKSIDNYSTRTAVSYTSEGSHRGVVDHVDTEAKNVHSSESEVHTQLYPLTTALRERVLQSLTEEQIEEAAKSSYLYYSLKSKAEVNSAQSSDGEGGMTSLELNKLRDQKALEMFHRHYVDFRGDADRALKGMQATLKYRVQRQFTEIYRCFKLNDSEFHKDVQRKIRNWNGPLGRNPVRGHDKEGRAMLHYMAKNSPEWTKTDPSGCLEAHMYFVERGLAITERRTAGKISSVSVAVNMEGFKKWHAPPTDNIIEMLTLLTHHYPERLHRVYLVDAPLIVRAIWAIVKPFAAKRIVDKFIFVTGEAMRRQIIEQMVHPDHSMPYLHPDGKLTDPIDMERFYAMEFDQDYDDTEYHT